MPSGKVEVNSRGLQIGMAQHHLNTAQVGAGFEEVGGEAVSERMRRDPLLDFSAFTGFSNGLPYDLLRNRLVRTKVVHRAGEKIRLWAHPPVVFTESREQFSAQGHLPVDTALALDYAQHHALAVDVAHLQSAQLGTAEASTVEGHEHRAVVQVARRRDQLPDLARTKNHRQPKALFWIWQILLHVSTLQHLDIQEAESADVQDHRVDGQFARSKQVSVIAPKVVGTDLVDGRIDVAAEMLDRLEVRVNGGGSVIAAYEFFSHPLDQFGHRNLL